MRFSEILTYFDDTSVTASYKGRRFENIMASWFRTDPAYAAQVARVWTWGEFPGRKDAGQGGHDVGIDLVVKTAEGEFWAVQCKCYKKDHHVTLAMVSNFIAAGITQFFDDEDAAKLCNFSRLIFVNTGRMTSTAKDAFKGKPFACTFINSYQLEQSAVDWQKLLDGIEGGSARLNKKSPLNHQIRVVEKAREYFMEQNHERGKLIMACGTGKTYTSLKVAEDLLGGKGLVLFLVPSISLLGQSLNAWCADAEKAIKAVCVCSDSSASRKTGRSDDDTEDTVADLALPASTNANTIAAQLQSEAFRNHDGLVVVFSTYQSIDAVGAAQKTLLDETNGEHGVFDLIICDEAHRTSSAQHQAKIDIKGVSDFVKVHDNKFVQGKKRLYMTATPRIYDANAKTKANEKAVVLYSMDNSEIYGEEIHKVNFAYAVENNLLTDYKVFIINVSEGELPAATQKDVDDAGLAEIDATMAAKMIGILKGLSKQMVDEDKKTTWEVDPRLMKRAMIFCSKIGSEEEPETSKNVAHILPKVCEQYNETLSETEKHGLVRVAARHVDGTMGSDERAGMLEWLREETAENECRVLSNVRCLSEGVDVPALDSVVFLRPMNSQIDVVQSIGRVMRTFAKGTVDEKKFGYIIVPVVVPVGADPVQIMNDNVRYKHVWQILQALRAHDDNFAAQISTLPDAKIKVTPPKPKPNDQKGKRKGGGHAENEKDDTPENGIGSDATATEAQLELNFEEEFQKQFYAKVVDKVGDREYWGKWGQQVGALAKSFKAKIHELIENNDAIKMRFAQFADSLRTELNKGVSDSQVIEMLSQHLIMWKVFDAIFAEFEFVRNNPISRSMHQMIQLFNGFGFEKETKTLDDFYDGVKATCRKIETLEAKQTIIKNLYERFFKGAFPETVAELGIVYTPVECVDFIINSVNDLLEKEFHTSLTEKDVHVLDPFTGTGTFVTRLLQSGFIKKEDLRRKYQNEIHCNEIVLLAYYIANVNIESVYHEVSGAKDYLHYDNIVLADTFNITEDKAALSYAELEENNERILRQQKSPIRVILGNPPYSVAKSTAHKVLDESLEKTYVANTKATNKNSIYDSYVQAFRWASDRLAETKEGGIIAFISNGGWLDGNAMDGMRKCFRQEFSDIYVFNLRGNQRTSGELSRKEGGKIFGSGSRAGITITFLVKNPAKAASGKYKAQIFYCDIGDYLSQKEKLSLVKNFKSVANEQMQWQQIVPNAKEDWLNMRDGLFDTLILIGDKKDKTAKTVFEPFYTRGLETARDVWIYNSSKKIVEANIKKTVKNFNNQFKTGIKDTDPTHLSWSSSWNPLYEKKQKLVYQENAYTNGLYRPFFKQNIYIGENLIHRPAIQKVLFPTPKHENLVIVVPGIGNSKEYLPLISNKICDLGFNEACQCFPLYYYTEQKTEREGELFAEHTAVEHAPLPCVRKDGVSDWILEQVKARYGASGKSLTKEHVFYYVYGLLHSKDYRARFRDDLKKSLPRIPIVESVDDFLAFYNAGKKLSYLHLNYESIEPLDSVVVTGDSYVISTGAKRNGEIYNEVDLSTTATPSLEVTGSAGGVTDGADTVAVGVMSSRVETSTIKDEYAFYAVQGKMSYAKKRAENGKSVADKTQILYNSHIRISNIPLKAYEYIVNGKSALDWIMERYCVSTDKDSGITNNANDWAAEHQKPRYILDLILSVINVSCQTVDLVNALPRLDFAEKRESLQYEIPSVSGDLLVADSGGTQNKTS